MNCQVCHHTHREGDMATCGAHRTNDEYQARGLVGAPWAPSIVEALRAAGVECHVSCGFILRREWTPPRTAWGGSVQPGYWTERMDVSGKTIYTTPALARCLGVLGEKDDALVQHIARTEGLAQLWYDALEVLGPDEAKRMVQASATAAGA